jgi:tetratricopeptide (TPR) repeat protein
MSADEADELYDHQKDYKIEESSSDIVHYQHELLDLLFEARQSGEARKLIADIETELKGHYARPVWLRLAKARLSLRERNVVQAMTILRHAVGVEAHKSVTSVLSPSIERLNEAVVMLKNEGFHNEALQLQEAAYARKLALDQYDASSFAGLANVAFERGDAKAGLTFLQMMIRLGDEETSAATSAEVASLPLIKVYEIADTPIERPESNNNIEIRNALLLAAEAATKWQLIEPAIEFRKRLQYASPEDSKNRLELARLLSLNEKIDEAVTALASVIGDRNAARSARWQGVWLAQEVIGEKKESWTTLQERVRALNANESELLAALNALALFADGKYDEALKSVETNVSLNPNPEIQFFRALLLKRSGQSAAALEAFNSTLQTERDAQIVSAFGFAEEGALRQAVRLYLVLDQPRAALKLAEQDRELKAEIEKQTKEKREEKYLTLDSRASELKERLRIELSATLKDIEERLKKSS